MYFGYEALFTCDACGNKFSAPACEWMASTIIAPMQCPKCGSMHTWPEPGEPLIDLFGFAERTKKEKKKLYQKIWEGYDEMEE